MYHACERAVKVLRAGGSPIRGRHLLENPGDAPGPVSSAMPAELFDEARYLGFARAVRGFHLNDP